jgi:hypothetical protein
LTWLLFEEEKNLDPISDLFSFLGLKKLLSAHSFAIQIQLQEIEIPKNPKIHSSYSLYNLHRSDANLILGAAENGITKCQI